MPYACEKPSVGPAEKIAETFSKLVPAIETERLQLRAPKLPDFALYSEIVCGERGRYVGGPMSREDAWYDFIQLSSGWMLHGHGGWAVSSARSGNTIGFSILGFEPGDREVELGYLFAEEAEGFGYATEASSAARDWAFSRLDWHSLVSYIDSDNTRSIRLAERLGANRDLTAEAELATEHPGLLVYRHNR